MEQKCYSKQELALQYFPDATPEVASAHLRRWINSSKRPCLWRTTYFLGIFLPASLPCALRVRWYKLPCPLG